MKKFTLGVIAGASSLALAVPLVAQLASAASGVSSNAARTQPIPSQTCVEALADADGTQLSNMDTFFAAHKTALQARKDALTAAATITDDTQRQEAVKKANDDFRTAMESQQDAMASARESVKTACGNAGGFGMGFGAGSMGMRGNGPDMKGGNFGNGMIAEKLGMTADELKSALDGGKTIQEIAEEKGVTLPNPGMGRGMHRGWNGSSTSDNQ
ncbi:MAG: hypothetical protein PHW10_00525 [Candidatus Peribacteraceae bacterium]|nr:hypothetical protein [Candidatus Peribacteraceae bacterium]